MDDRLKWMEVRISSSLRPRNEDLKNMITNDDNRLAFYEFVNNEDVKRLFVYIRPPRQITASMQPPHDLKSKSIFFMKCNPGTKLTKDNMDNEVFYMDSTSIPLEHLELTLREVFLPLLGTNTPSVTGAGINGDKLMDILHRLMAAVEVSQGHVEGRIVLNLPSIEVLAEVAATPSRRAAVLHVLETTVIGWIKQIRGVLRHDPQSDLALQAGAEPGPLDEVQMWEKHLSRLRSINKQLDSDVAKDILNNLEQADSQYAHSFQSVRKDISKAESETMKILKFLSTMRPWFQQLHDAIEPRQMLKLFKPLMTVLNLVWSHSVYYHQIDKFHNLLRLLSNEVVHRAIALVGEDILREPLESYTKLKEALRVCAAFRGTYLDFKDKADDKNAQNIAENAERLAARPHGNLFTTKMYGPHAYTPRYGLRNLASDGSSTTLNEEDLMTDSPWPPRNAPCFDLLNSFMERCNDVLELVETTRHFRLLAGAAEVGGAGSMSLDAMVKEIHQKYSHAMHEFFSAVSNVLNIDGSQSFERAFFKFRTVVKSLEKRLSGILRQSFSQCPTVESQLRLLEVFEGVSGREMVQLHIKDKDQQLVTAFTAELTQVREMFSTSSLSPPLHKNMPPVVSKLMWVYGLRQRIKVPMEKMRQVSPHSLEGDRGWQMRDFYSDLMKDLDKYESDIISYWQSNITAELTLRLKQPLLIAEEYDEDTEERPQVIHVNLDPQLLLLLREVRYISQPPFSTRLPPAAKELLRNTDSFELGVTATRLETIVSNYNSIMRTLTAFEKPMFERKLAQIDLLLEQGLSRYTWRMKESADFIESAMSLVCMDVHQNLDVVQTGCHDIAAMTISWSTGTLDVFSARQPSVSNSMEELLELQKRLDEELENVVVPSGNKIHGLVQNSFEVVQISQASPAWQDYIDYIDAIVLDGLKQSTLTSLRTMLNTLVQANMVESDEKDDDDEERMLPVLTIRLELIENSVAFRPPLDQTSSVISVQELVSGWLSAFVARGRLVKMLGPKGSYEDYIAADEEVKQLLSDISQLVDDNAEECKKLLDEFKEYAFLWQQDVNQTFEDFLNGRLTPNPLRSTRVTRIDKQQVPQPPIQTDRSSQASRGSSARSAMSAEVYENAERTFLTPKGATDREKSNVPSLDEFDNEIDIYRTARDEVENFDDYHCVGWLRVDVQPIKQVLTTYASKWMWTFTKYLSDQVTAMLENLDMFLKRIEPEIESITGEERDTASFMKMMRLFNEVSAQQSEMDGKFAAMHRTVLLLKKYGQILPEKTQYLFSAAPGRWSNLKTKVSLAKQRLGPRIQEESASISQDLEKFSLRVMGLQQDLENSDVYNRECSISEAYLMIDNFSKQLVVLENEAQDLIELQELLEASVVNFTVLPSCRYELNNLKQVWETVRVIDDQQSEWKRHRWQKMNTKFLREETNKQLEIVKGLPDDVLTWDVYMGLHESITTIQACLPLIDDLSNPAMRTRHWKQLVRVTGGAFTIDNDTLKRMTLKELLSLGLQKHVDDVRAIVQRAVKDLAIEMSLKTYEEVWLSKIFDLRPHTRNKTPSSELTQDNQSEYSQSEAGASQNQGPAGRQMGTRTTSRISNQSSHSKNKRSSISSLPASLLNLGEDSGHLLLLTNTEPIFEELEHHQVTLQAMQSNSAAGSFLDEVLKWQKKLQTIEAVLTTWLEAQEKWVELEEVYTGADVRAALSHDANRFAMVNKDFRLLMRATERNPNVLQCCSRKNILKILQHMTYSLETCRKSLLNHLERRRQIFPRFYFLSMEDVLHIVCNGYDLNQVNLYISKLFEHLGSLVFEEVEDNDKYGFIITGVDSALGERLHFQQPVACEGQIETWLTTFLTQLKSSLQYQLATAMGVEKPQVQPPPRAEADRKATAASAKPESSLKKDPKGGSRSMSRMGSRLSQREPVPPETEAVEPEPEPVEYAERDDGGRSWTLEHVSEIVYLATQIQMSSQIKDALASLEGGDSKALEDALEKIDAGIQGTILLLKGLEGEKESRINKHKQKTETEAGQTGAATQEGGGEQDSMVDLAGARSLTSLQKASTQDLTGTGEELRTPPPEEEGGTTPRGPASDAQSAALVDTMNISLPALMEAGEEAEAEGGDRKEEGEGGEEEEEEMKLMLFPSQIHKLTCLLSLLSHLRDLVGRLTDMAPRQPPATSFDWRSQLLYSFVEETRGVTVHCMNTPFEYGFEYLGSSSREVITPQTERMFVTMTQAIKAHTGVLCMGPKECGKFMHVREVSLCLGRPLYVFNCTFATSSLQIHDIFRGLASTGCWVSFVDVVNLQLPVLSVFTQLMSTVVDALRQSKAAVHLQSDDVQLSPHGAIFALMDSAIPVTACDPERPLLYPAATSRLPDGVRELFRVVSVMTLDFQLSLEVMLFSQGFVHGRELAQKTKQLYDMCRRMFGTNAYISDKAILGQESSGSFYGWSLHSLKGVVAEAGAHMVDRLGIDDKEAAKIGSDMEKHESETSEKQRESDAAKKVGEESSLVTALRDTFVPRMNARDASLFATLVQDLWPHVDVPMVFGGGEEAGGGGLSTSTIHPTDSLQTIKSELRIKSSKSAESQRSLKDSLNLNTPVVPMLHASKEHFGTVLDQIGKQVLDNMQDAIAVATGDLGLLPGAAFQARVMQLAQLNAAHQTILVVGPSGCGKSECIKTFAVAEKERGKVINIQSVFTKAVESQELMGYVDPKTKEWQEGLLTSLLRKFCIQPPNINYDINAKPTMKIMQLDGECDPHQMELLHSILNNSGTVVLANNERISIPPTLRFIWEMESLEAMTPSLLASVGVLVMSEGDVGWKLMLVQWLEHRNEADKDLLTSLCDTYVQRIVDYVTECTRLEIFGAKKHVQGAQGSGSGSGSGSVPGAGACPKYTRCIQHSVVNMVHTFIMLLEALVHSFNDLSDVEYERYFSYAAVWSFGGTLDAQHRESFSNWWRSQFDQHIDYPEDGTVFDYVVDNETHNFCKWGDLIPSYTGTPHQGIPYDAFVHTVQTEQLLHLVGVLTDAGKPVMLVGENGCGKTAIINERIRTVCSGEVAEVLSLTVYANRFTNARLLFDRVDERLEWKHGRTHVPKGNKRLLCLIDDINLSQVDSFGHQTACELVREHLDDGGFYSPSTHTWRYVKNVTYVTTLNPRTTAATPGPSHRLLRHFAIFGCPYPGDKELQTVFTTLLGTHFFTPELSGGGGAGGSGGGGGGTGSSAAQHLGISDDKVSLRLQGEEMMRDVIGSLVCVTVELHNRMRTMFLPTAQRCHYIFTARDLANIFRNVCLSLQPGCDKRNLLLLWQHECYWVYGRRMVSEVDIRRFRQAFITAVRKQFIDDDQIQSIVRPRTPLFSNLMEQDSGIVTAGMIDARSSANVTEEDARTDLYKPAKSAKDVTDLLEKGVEEFNKIHPRIKLALYKSVVEQVCRLARTMASPHEGANTVLVAEGCPGRCTVLVKLAAHLCGFTVFQPSPTPNSTTVASRLDQFKSDLVLAYTRAGTKGEKLTLLIHEEELVTDELLVYLTEFIVSCSISHLFTHEEQTTIINSIRTEVTQAGLTYTRDVAWNFFLRTVRNNCRVCLIVSDTDNGFQRMCRHYPAFTKNVNFIWFQHWSKSQLVEHALFHLKGVEWMTAVQRENVAHMVASMHLVLRQQDGGEKTTGEYGHVTNTTYEKFVEKFISLANERHAEIEETQQAVTKTLEQIRHENEMAIKLKKQLEHEMIVLEERKAGTIKILSQIGQDTAITEQQIRVVKNQLEKIDRLKKLLPEYQVAHERAVYKAIAIVADTKKVVKTMDREKLAELRAMSKPSMDIEDLMASIIMILKSPSADLTWQKGAKRQMANLDRFIDEELMTFDDTQLPESTLVLVEPYLKKQSFDPEDMERKTGNSACGSLCRWVRGVVRYHRMMLSKVKPLHQKVEETTQAVDNAQHKMNTLESKRKTLEVRLADLARAFEEATIDKNEQEDKTVNMRKTLDTAAQLRRILRGERQRCQQIFDSYKRRLVAVSGGCAMAAGLATYLGPYHHNFRRVMLTVHWPNCLRERGIPLVIDSVDVLKGRVIDWSINFLKTASGASSVYEVDFTSVIRGEAEALDAIEDVAEQAPAQAEDKTGEGSQAASRPASQGEIIGGAGAGEQDKEEDKKGEGVTEKMDKEKPLGESQEGDGPPRTPKSPKEKEAGGEGKGENGTPPRTPKEGGGGGEEAPPRTPKSGVGTPSKDKAGSPPQTPKDDGKATPPKTPKDGAEGDAEDPQAKTPKSPKEARAADPSLSQIPEEDMDDDDARTQFTESSAPILTTSQYSRYLRSLIKLLVGETTLNEWIRKDFGPRQIENAAILCSSWQRPPMMIDPNGEGGMWLGRLNKLLNHRKLVSVDMENRTDPHIILTLERAITKGKPVVIKNCEEVIDNFITPLIHHRNTAMTKDREEDPRMILFCGRRTLCHQDFRFYLSTQLPKPRFSAAIAATTTLVNFGVSNDTLIEDLLARTFASIRPELHRERITALRNLQLLKDTLYQFSGVLKGRVLSSGQKAMLSSPKSLQFITNITQARLQLAEELSKTQTILDDLDLLKDELYPVARRGALMFALMRSLASVRHEYQFTMDYFLQLFDEAIGGELPPGFGFGEDEDDGYEEEESVSDAKKPAQRPGSTTSQLSTTEQPAETKTEAEGGAMSAVEEESTQQQPQEGTEVESTSASTGAAHKLIHGSDSEDLPPVELPDTAQLPTPEVEYTSLPIPNIKQLMESVMMLVFHRVKQSLLEEDHLLLRTLLCLNVQLEAGEDFSSEEMSLFLQGNPGLGMQLTLSDFDSKDSPPAWLSQDRWEDILALSVLPGPLDSLCVSFAAASDTWHEWFKSPYPDQEPLPLTESEAIKAQENKVPEGTRGSTQHVNPGSPDLGPLNDFHQLLILRMLRPDRLPAALAHYTDRHLSLHDPLEDSMNMAEVLLDARSHLGILLLLPTSAASPTMVPESRLKLTSNPVDVLCGVAKAVGIEVTRVMMGEGCEYAVEDALHQADKKDQWLVVEGLHLAPPAFFVTFRQHLARIHKSRANMSEEQRDSSHFCVWMTCKTDSAVPDHLVQRLHKVSWTHVLSLARPQPQAAPVQQAGGAGMEEQASPQPQQPPQNADGGAGGGGAGGGAAGGGDGGEEDRRPPESAVDSYVTPQKYLREAILTALRQVPAEVWEEIQSESALIRNLAFAMALIQGCLVARQLFGSAGLTRWYPFGSIQIVNAIWFLVGRPLLTTDGSEPGLSDLCHCVSQLLYGSLVCNEADARYVTALTQEVLEAVYRDPASEVLLGTELIPVPPADMAPKDFADWFEKTAADNMTLGALQLHTSIEQQVNEASSHRFITKMYRMHETQSLESGEVIRPSTEPRIDIDKLRSALDICLEKLPPMLELGQVPQLLTQEFNFPYHRPSIISLSSASSDLMPESIGHALLQECLWMNALLCHMRQQIFDLQTAMVGGPLALPRPLLSVIRSIQEELVPVSWTHPNTQPCTHSLLSWLDDLAQRHKQLHAWVKRRMVPTFDDRGRMVEQSIGRGRLTSVWLGGLVNPQALITALRQEKAVLVNKSVDQITLKCVVLNSQDVAEFDVDEGGLFVNDIYLQGADWNYQQDKLDESKSSLFHIPCLYICPLVKRDPEQRSPEDRDYSGADPEDHNTKTSTKQPTPPPPPAQEDNSTTAATDNKEGSGEGENKENREGDGVDNKEDNKENEAAKKEEGEGAGTTAATATTAASEVLQSPKAPSHKSSSVAGERDEDSTAETYDCPVYMNKSRQIQVCMLPVNCPNPAEKWTLASAAFILDRGLPDGASKKSRSYLLLQRLPTTLRKEEEEEDQMEEEEEQEEEEEEEEGPQGENGSQISSRTQQSQLSYKPMTPKASPLPMGLGLTREPAMIKGSQEQVGGAVEPPLVSSRPSSAQQQQQQQGSRPPSASRQPRPPSGQRRPGSTTSQGVQSQHSRGKESEAGQASLQEEAAAEAAASHQGTGTGEAEDQKAQPSTPRGEEPPIERLDRQGELQRGEDRVLADSKENQVEEKEKDETEEAEKTQMTSSKPPTDAGAGHQVREHTPHPASLPPRGPSAGSRKKEEDERAGDKPPSTRSADNDNVQPAPPVKEDDAGRGGQAESESPEPPEAERKPAAEDARSTTFTERAEDSLHVDADMKASGGKTDDAK
ncbi:uncharacterized protein LOC143291635 isoform X3 [Babylonia areolata]|uniref:uncharacterized protein LOC143291635 isoform X3 n=1 Tax=Babylonia areolata TaxID=304850 RepID=UPI003FD0EDB6